MMKTKKVKLFMLCLIFSGFSLGISAQTHLDALIKKSEKHKSVDMEVVKTKQTKGKAVETETVRIRIRNDKKMVNEFLDAFKKDAPDAEQAMFRKRAATDKIFLYRCEFPKNIYTIFAKAEGNAEITVGSNPITQYRSFFIDSIKRINQKEMIEQRKEMMEKQKEKMEQQRFRIKQRLDKLDQQKLDSILSKHQIIADSLVMKSLGSVRSINWDSVASKFGDNMKTLIDQLGVGWDEIIERYELKNP